MFSIKTDKCNSPLPETTNLSGLSPGSTLKATLCISSCSSLSFRFLDEMYFPSLPAKGESFTWKVMLTVGSSTERGGRVSTASGSHIVSEIFSLSMPVIQTMSPA